MLEHITSLGGLDPQENQRELLYFEKLKRSLVWFWMRIFCAYASLNEFGSKALPSLEATSLEFLPENGMLWCMLANTNTWPGNFRKWMTSSPSRFVSCHSTRKFHRMCDNSFLWFSVWISRFLVYNQYTTVNLFNWLHAEAFQCFNDLHIICIFLFFYKKKCKSIILIM